jgi:hypothetical protein
MFAVLAVALAVPPAPFQAAAIERCASAVVYARDERGWQPVFELDREKVADSYPLPLISLSERVRRVARTSKGIRVRVYAGAQSALAIDAVRLEAVAHAADWQILRDNGGPLLVGPGIRPGMRDAWIGALARQDGNCVAIEELIAAQKAAAEADTSGRTHALMIARSRSWPTSLFVLGGEARDPKSLAPGVRDTWSVTCRDTANFELRATDLGRRPVDQVLIAESRTLLPEMRRALELRTAHASRASIGGWERYRGEGLSWPVLAELPPDAQGAPLPADESVLASIARADEQALQLDPGMLLELAFDAPAAAEAGQTWTMLLTIQTKSKPLFVAGPPAVEEPRGMFREVARQAGIDVVHVEGPDQQLDIRPTMGPGAAWGDYDGDGWVDLFLPSGGGSGSASPPTSRMYKNLGNGRFADVSQEVGLARVGAGMGALFYDADGDWDLDLFVANYGANAFYVNNGLGQFNDATSTVGLAGDNWHAAVSAADYDRDGDLDLYVTSYLRYDEKLMPPADELARYNREDPIAMLPFAFPGERKLLLRADLARERVDPNVPASGLKYVDVAEQLGVLDPGGRGMQALFWDFDRDGDQDLSLANDVSPNGFWRNEGDGTFKDIAFQTGMDDPRGCMGLSAGDVDGDGDEDLFITNWQLEANALYVNNLVTRSAKQHVATFRDNAVEAGLAQASVGVTKWGCELADFDNDGDLDLFYVNGYTSPDYESTGICVGQPGHYFENDGEGKFTPAFEKAGPDLAAPLPSRAAVACDYDHDGDLDVAVTANNGRARLFENTLASKHAWLGVRLRGRGPNTHAIGAEVELQAGDRTWRRTLRAGTSYLSGNAPELHFGLGATEKVDGLTVRWPSGQTSRHAVDALRTFVTIAEPAPEGAPR